MPLEGLWWMDDMRQFSVARKDEWKWTMMIMQPAIVMQPMAAATRPSTPSFELGNPEGYGGHVAGGNPVQQFQTFGPPRAMTRLRSNSSRSRFWRLRLAAALLLALLVSRMAGAEPADLIVTNALVVTMNSQREVFSPGTVVIRGDRIVAVGPAAVAGEFTAPRTIDAAGGIVMPGMINTHTHVAMSVFRGLGDDVADRLRRYIWPLEAKVVDADLVYWGALHGLMEMVEGGVTTFVDSYPHPESTTRAAREIGIRGVITYGVKDDLAPARKFAERYRHDPLIIPAIGLHSPYDNTAEQIKQAALLSKELDLRVSMHVAEMDFELEQLNKKYHQTPIEYLNSLGLLSPRFLAAHCILLTDGDIALLKANDVGVAHNMVANVKSAKGVAPVLKLRAAGVRVGLGTDGAMSGNTLDVIGQLGYVAKVHKLANHDRTVMPAVDVVEMATIGGARALHLEDRIGSLEVGKLADLIVIDTNSTSMVPLYDPYTALVYAASPRDVRTTLINGREVMRDRRVLTVDAQDVKEHVRALMKNIQSIAATLK
jgi:cytosine/adenosine deaminase-related metal-dependent hydrolase